VDRDYHCDNYNEFVFSKISTDEVFDKTVSATKFSSSSHEGDNFKLCGSALGITFVKDNAAKIMTELLCEVIATNNKKIRMDTLLDKMLEKGVDIGVVFVSSQDWIDVNAVTDFERASEL
ncbi:MAG: hypothetical protein RR497_03775, partial [Oscillospiraceae bacterium]